MASMLAIDLMIRESTRIGTGAILLAWLYLIQFNLRYLYNKDFRKKC